MWALARLLPVYMGEGSDNVARSLRRQFALVGVVLGAALIGALWDSTANLAVIGAASVVIAAGLWLYSEHGDRSEP
jgi:hypothetical protein